MPSKSSRILFIHHGKGLGGAPRSLSQLVTRLVNDGHDVHVLLLHDSEAKSLYSNASVTIVGLPLLYFNHSSRWYRYHEIHKILYQILSWFLTFFVIAPYWLMKIKPDLVYLNSSVLSDWLVVSKLFRLKTITHVREAVAEGYFGMRRKFLRIIIDRFSDVIFFLSQDNYHRLQSRSEKSRVVYNYVVSEENLLSLDEKRWDYIYVGGEREIKGIEAVVHAIESGFEGNICLLGYYGMLLSEKLSAYHNVELIGPVDNPLYYIAKSRFLLFPATTPHFPRPVIEAMSLSVIPLVSSLEGMEEIVCDGVNGFTFECNDKESMLLKMKQVNNYSGLDEVKDQAYKTYQEKFSQRNEDKIIGSILGLLRE